MHADTRQDHVTGRLTSIVPFFPFTPLEASVIAHKYILALQRQVRTPINLSTPQMLGNVELTIDGDGKVCKYIAQTGYDVMFGARSLDRSVGEMVRAELVRKYLDVDDEVTESMNDGDAAQYVVQLREMDGVGKEICVIALAGKSIVGKDESVSVV